MFEELQKNLFSICNVQYIFPLWINEKVKNHYNKYTYISEVFNK